MKGFCKILLLVLGLFASCTPEEDYGASGLAIDMSVHVQKTKSITKSVADLQNSGIGIYGYKEQLSDSEKKFMVFENQRLEYSGSTWTYSPKRYWDTQTKYSFIAYAPFDENNVEVHGYSNITINAIQQWQNADDTSSKDYIVALAGDAATEYIKGGGTVNLNFHHILANLQITAYKEGDSDFKIQNITIGADIDNQRVPADDAERSYVQNFGHERADGSFIDDTLNGTSISLFEGNMAVESAINKVANLLVAPFTAGADLPLTITYTENGAEKSAVVNSGITEFKSDAVYTVNLKFTSTVTDEPAGPSGPGIEVVPGPVAYGISFGDRKISLSITEENGAPILGALSGATINEYFWHTSKGTEITGEENKQALYVTYNGINYYLSAGVTNGNETELTLTADINEALELYREFPDGNPYGYIFARNINGERLFLKYDQNSQKFVLENSQNLASSQVVIYKMLGRIICRVDETGYAGPAIYFHIANNDNYDYENNVMDFDRTTRLTFDDLITRGLSFGLGFDGNITRYSTDTGNPNCYDKPQVYYQTTPDFYNPEWTVVAADGTDISQYAEMQGQYSNDQYAIKNTLVYKQKCPVDTDVVVTLTYKHRTNPEIVKVGYYRLTLKGTNSSN